MIDMYRVVETDNYGRDYPDEKFSLPYHLRKEDAVAIAAVLNSGPEGNRYWKVVPTGYELAPGFEP